jgi:two-component system, cell cycle response regulator CpdR
MISHTDRRHGRSNYAVEGVHLLLVEDEPRLRRATHRQLHLSGYRVWSCADGGEALDLLKGDVYFDLVLSDIDMPVVDGVELASRMHAAGLPTPLILLSGLELSEHAIQRLRHPTPVLQKPLNLEQLHGWVHRLTARSGYGAPSVNPLVTGMATALLRASQQAAAHGQPPCAKIP